MTNAVRNNIIPMTMPTPGSSTTSRNTEPGVLKKEFQRVVNEYNQILGNMPAPVAQYIATLMRQGMEADVIIYAIGETAWASRPSPRYLRAILERYQVSDIMDMSDLIHDPSYTRSMPVDLFV